MGDLSREFFLRNVALTVRTRVTFNGFTPDEWNRFRRLSKWSEAFWRGRTPFQEV